jgi:hypothetical protein
MISLLHFFGFEKEEKSTEFVELVCVCVCGVLPTL